MNTSDEKWLPVVGYEGLYEVSDQGQVRNVSGHVKSLNINPENGYVYVTLCRSGRKKTCTVHGIVARAFLPPQAGEVCHDNGDRRDNRATNLRIDSRSGNHLDKWKHGTMPHGVGHVNHVLNPEQVLEIRASVGSLCSVARAYSINPSTVRDIRQRRTWRWLKESQVANPLITT